MIALFPRKPASRACFKWMIALLNAAMVAQCGVAWSKPVSIGEPIPARIVIRQKGTTPSSVVEGSLIAADSDSLIVKTSTDEEKQLKWTDLTGPTAYKLRFQLINKKDPAAWLELGTFAWGVNDTADAKIALANAAQLDHDLKDDVEAVEASTAGILYDPPSDEQTDLLHDIPPGQMDSRGFDPSRLLKDKYTKVWPAQAKKAIAATRHDAKLINDSMGLKLKEIDTAHFLIYTDWGPQSDAFLKTNMEDAYKIVSKQFEIPQNENIFVGKLGVYMFNSYEDFLKFSQAYDNLPKTLPKGSLLMGYYKSRGAVMEHMAMSKPDKEKLGLQTDIEAAKRWGYTLTHEFTHAFIARYRSGRRIPDWLNEGIAEVIASSQFPRDVKSEAAAMAGMDFTRLFKDTAGIQSADMYPVMRTLAETLLKKDGKKFIRMFDDLKAGATGEQALHEAYNWTFDDLKAAWRNYVGLR